MRIGDRLFIWNWSTPIQQPSAGEHRQPSEGPVIGPRMTDERIIESRFGDRNILVMAIVSSFCIATFLFSFRVIEIKATAYHRRENTSRFQHGTTPLLSRYGYAFGGTPYVAAIVADKTSCGL